MDINKLKERVSTDPVAKDVCLNWAQRLRGRGDVTTIGLVQGMYKEGFKHPRTAYNAFLEFLGAEGYGDLKKFRNGNIKLSHIKTTLQSIGRAGLGQSAELEVYKTGAKTASKPRRKRRIRQVRAVKRLTVTVPPVSPQVEQKLMDAPETKLSLVYRIGDKHVYISIPQDMLPNQVAELVTKLRAEVSV